MTESEAADLGWSPSELTAKASLTCRRGVSTNENLGSSLRLLHHPIRLLVKTQARGSARYMCVRSRMYWPKIVAAADNTDWTRFRVGLKM